VYAHHTHATIHLGNEYSDAYTLAFPEQTTHLHSQNKLFGTTAQINGLSRNTHAAKYDNQNMDIPLPVHAMCRS